MDYLVNNLSCRSRYRLVQSAAEEGTAAVFVYQPRRVNPLLDVKSCTKKAEEEDSLHGSVLEKSRWPVEGRHEQPYDLCSLPAAG